MVSGYGLYIVFMIFNSKILAMFSAPRVRRPLRPVFDLHLCDAGSVQVHVSFITRLFGRSMFGEGHCNTRRANIPSVIDTRQVLP